MLAASLPKLAAFSTVITGCMGALKAYNEPSPNEY